MILADLSGLLSLHNRREPTHLSVAEPDNASMLVLADRLGIDRVLTLDRRHFEPVRIPSGRALAIVP